MSFPLIIPQGAYPTYVSIFRPLAGITVFRTVRWLPTGVELTPRFRPLAGITVFRTWGYPTTTLNPGACFRPLAGITVFRTGP